MPIEVGNPAPPFSLNDATGHSVSLADFRGQNVIVYFYPKDETPGCTKQACAFRDLWAEIQALNTTVLGISPDGGESHEAFSANHDLPFTLLSDPDREVMTTYGAFGEKTMYGKTVTGVIRSTVWVGPDGQVVKHWPKVSRAADHPAKVLEALQAESSESR